MGNERKYNLEKFDKPIKKDVRDLEKDDVVTFEFADYDNWVVAIIKDYKVRPSKESDKYKILEMSFEGMYGHEDKCYGFIDNESDYLLDVIGKAVACEKNQIENIQDDIKDK